jgi:hypothetical protein
MAPLLILHVFLSFNNEMKEKKIIKRKLVEIQIESQSMKIVCNSIMALCFGDLATIACG